MTTKNKFILDTGPTGLQRRKNIVGRRYGRLVVESFSHTAKNGNGSDACWNCICDCGNKTVVRTRCFSGPHPTQSCGCFRTEQRVKAIKTHGESHHKTAEYCAWASMIQRCCNPDTREWHNYGGRGIKVCRRWRHSFETFLSDMGRRPSPLHSLDRFPNNNGHYEPGNCRWATPAEQMRNRRNNFIVVINGTSMCLTDAAKQIGMHISTLKNRIIKGIPLDVPIGSQMGPGRLYGR